MNKYIDNYDEIIDISNDMKFINEFLLYKSNFEISSKQLEKIYELEYENYDLSLEIAKYNINPFILEKEREIIYHLLVRIKLLIIKCKLESSLKYLPDEAKLLVEDSINGYEKQIEEETKSILKLCIKINNKFNTLYILGKERNIKKYRELLDNMNNKNIRTRRK